MAGTILLKAAAASGACAYCLVILASKDVPGPQAAVLGAASLFLALAPVAVLWHRAAGPSPPGTA